MEDGHKLTWAKCA